MSLFLTIEVPCQACGVPVLFELNHSINVDRRPDLRDEVLDRTFQKEKCSSCGHAFRVEPEFNYLDVGRGQWLAIWPTSKLPEWTDCVEKSQTTFDKAFGVHAPADAAVMGKELTPRAVFGWEALHEKLVAAEAGIDDVELELAKIAVVRNLEDAPLASNFELRLLGADDQELTLGWFQTGIEDLTEVVTAPRSVLADIEKAQKDWKDLRADMTSTMFVDMQKLMLPKPAPTA
jgi:hypothetical protein